ncbi:type III secretion system inner rod subunit SctI [Yersinia nurmii]|uniref:Type III secretion system inner rod subunit SctI n=1 Tax=Yersinia nurmii TaxID=685706 RepID=A0AAW7K582_9GAMM|nr:type III secretion system inner rod subunit SctI [Yersinia nurmii]MDN0088877.1 type III secretion system inner rod subunit SctI [Yersinia nurmii]CNF07818.1 type III secretion system needle complex protein PrgJ [Yersinia nurmii]
MSHLTSLISFKNKLPDIGKPVFDGAGQIEGVIKKLFSQQAAATSQEKAAIVNLIEHGNITDPAELIRVGQIRLGKHAEVVSLANTLVRKGISAVETTIKSQ